MPWSMFTFIRGKNKVARNEKWKSMWVFEFQKYEFQKYGIFWSISLGHFIKHKPLISEECYSFSNTVFFIFSSDNFVDPITGTHTQNVERYWKAAKSKLKKMYGCQTSQLESHLDEFQWRYMHDRLGSLQTLNNLWTHMVEWYNPEV